MPWRMKFSLPALTTSFMFIYQVMRSPMLPHVDLLLCCNSVLLLEVCFLSFQLHVYSLISSYMHVFLLLMAQFTYIEQQHLCYYRHTRHVLLHGGRLFFCEKCALWLILVYIVLLPFNSQYQAIFMEPIVITSGGQGQLKISFNIFSHFASFCFSSLCLF